MILFIQPEGRIFTISSLPRSPWIAYPLIAKQVFGSPYTLASRLSRLSFTISTIALGSETPRQLNQHRSRFRVSAKGQNPFDKNHLSGSTISPLPYIAKDPAAKMPKSTHSRYKPRTLNLSPHRHQPKIHRLSPLITIPDFARLITGADSKPTTYIQSLSSPFSEKDKNLLWFFGPVIRAIKKTHSQVKR